MQAFRMRGFWLFTAGVCSAAALQDNHHEIVEYKNKLFTHILPAAGKKTTRILHASADSTIHVHQMADDSPLVHKMKPYERRFHSFASIEHHDTVYMTPRDLLDSLTTAKPRNKSFRRVLDDNEVRIILNGTPKKWKGSSSIFRNLDNCGLISYSEYLFLLGVLTKPRSGFGIAFTMFDTDGNQEIDMPEFLVLNKIIAGIHAENQDTPLKDRKAEIAGTINKPNTTLLVHFFGVYGRDKVTFKDFEKFMENFQTEILEIEFLEHSRGLKTMAEEDFARVLLQYSKITPEKHNEIIERVKLNLTQNEGITFDEFKKFFLFLNSLPDFALAMKMYTLADRAISKQEFQLAVNSSVGFKLADSLVQTLFLVFDADNDGHLSHKEFVRNMRDRLSRGLLETPSHSVSRWNSFQRCVQTSIKESD